MLGSILGPNTYQQTRLYGFLEWMYGLTMLRLEFYMFSGAVFDHSRDSVLANSNFKRVDRHGCWLSEGLFKNRTIEKALDLYFSFRDASAWK